MTQRKWNESVCTVKCPYFRDKVGFKGVLITEVSSSKVRGKEKVVYCERVLIALGGRPFGTEGAVREGIL